MLSMQFRYIKCQRNSKLVNEFHLVLQVASYQNKVEEMIKAIVIISRVLDLNPITLLLVVT